MSKVFNIVLIFFLATNLASGANAGRGKGYTHNNYQTKQQQIKYAQMTEKDVAVPFSPSFDSGIRITTPVQQAIAIMLGLSLMADAVAAPKRPLPYPFRAPGSDEARISDQNHDLFACSQEVKQPTEALLAFVHPGLFNRPRPKMSQSQIDEDCNVRNLHNGKAHGGQMVCIPDQEMLQTLELDQRYRESGLYDRLNSDQAWTYIVEAFFESAALPIREFFGTNRKQFQDNIKKLNAVFQYGLSNGKPGSEEFRPKESIVFIRHNDEFPANDRRKDWKRYIKKNCPHLLDSYSEIEKIANDLHRYYKNLPSSAHLFDLETRLQYALEYIISTGTFENYLVLSENFSYGPSYSTKEFDKLFRALRTETLKLFENDPIKAAAYFHFQYVSIHPHPDANGRTARAGMNIILMSAGIEPVIFPSNNQYTEACFLSAREKSSAPFEIFLRSVVQTQQQEKEVFTELVEKLNSCKKNCQVLLDSHF